jgi:hypothetical protein
MARLARVWARVV